MTMMNNIKTRIKQNAFVYLYISMFLVFASFSCGTKIQKTIWQQTAHIFIKVKNEILTVCSSSVCVIMCINNDLED